MAAATVQQSQVRTNLSNRCLRASRRVEPWVPVHVPPGCGGLRLSVCLRLLSLPASRRNPVGTSWDLLGGRPPSGLSRPPPLSTLRFPRVVALRADWENPSAYDSGCVAVRSALVVHVHVRLLGFGAAPPLRALRGCGSPLPPRPKAHRWRGLTHEVCDCAAAEYHTQAQDDHPRRLPRH